MELINYQFNFSILGCINEGKIKCIGSQPASVDLMTVFHPFPFKSGQILVAPHHLTPVLSWVVQGYLWLKLVLPHLTLDPPFASFYLYGFPCTMPRRDCTKTSIAMPLLSVVLMFCNVYLMFKGADFNFFECLIGVFGCWFHVLLRVFHVSILE